MKSITPMMYTVGILTVCRTMENKGNLILHKTGPLDCFQPHLACCLMGKICIQQPVNTTLTSSLLDI